MRIQIASNLHLEDCPDCMPDEATFRLVRERELLVLADNIGVHMMAWALVERELETSPVVYFPGNQECYTTKRR